MSEKDLGRALLDLDSRKLSGASDAREQTWKVLERDRRRVWWLTVLTVATWAAAMLMVLWMLVAFGLLFPQQARLRDEAQLARLSPESREAAHWEAEIAFKMITVGVTCSVGILALASLSTVLLVVITRRATLRQINANLVEISEQLKALRQTPPQAAPKQ
jgi:hypothetical protein